MGKKGFPWRHLKKNDDVAGSSAVKKKETKPRNRVPVRIDVAWALYNSMIACEGWDDVHLPDGWLLSHRRVPIPPVPRSGQARRDEIVHGRSLLPSDLRVDPAYAVNSPMWDTFSTIKYDPRRRSGFLGDDEYVYGPPPRSRRAPRDVKMEDAAPPDAEEQLVGGDDIPGEENQDDTDDYIGLLLYEAQRAREQGRLDQLPAQPGDLTEEEATRLAILMSQLPEPPQPLPRYAAAHMPAGLSEEEAFRLALQASAPPPLPSSSPWDQWPASASSTLPPPLPPVYHMPSSVPNWPWETPVFVDLTRDGDDEQ